MPRARFTTLCLILIAPALIAAKCIDYDPALSIQALVAAGDGTDQIVPFVECADPSEAQLLVSEFLFEIGCGCVEEPANVEPIPRTCTVAAGTTVVWRFAGSEEHNVTSSGSLFPNSTNLSAGRFEQTFDTPGDYPYGCAIHPAEMFGYVIQVR